MSAMTIEAAAAPANIGKRDATTLRVTCTPQDGPRDCSSSQFYELSPRL